MYIALHLVPYMYISFPKHRHYKSLTIAPTRSPTHTQSIPPTHILTLARFHPHSIPPTNNPPTHNETHTQCHSQTICPTPSPFRVKLILQTTTSCYLLLDLLPICSGPIYLYLITQLNECAQVLCRTQLPFTYTQI